MSLFMLSCFQSIQTTLNLVCPEPNSYDFFFAQMLLLVVFFR